MSAPLAAPPSVVDVSATIPPAQFATVTVLPTTRPLGASHAAAGHDVTLTLYLSQDRGSRTCIRSSKTVDPETYLIDIMTRLLDHPTNRVHELLPHAWKVTQTTPVSHEQHAA